jgi:glycosyltransferase involved in cell wall biosynthesis
MELVAQMLLQHLDAPGSSLDPTAIVAPFRRRFTHLWQRGVFFKADRFLNRWRDYPQYAATLTAKFDVFHVIDHSYAHLLHALPQRPSVVTCHDLDAFRCVLEPERDRRSELFRRVTEYVLSGFRRATRVVCDSQAVFDELIAHRVIDPRRLSVVPLGAHPACSPHPNPASDAALTHLLGVKRPDGPELLHVGSTISRKRIDVLLHLFAGIREQYPRARLMRVGGPFTRRQFELVRRLGLEQSIHVLPFLDRQLLSALYRRASLLVLPSDREGFGLPLVEALACGTPAAVTDLPVLREVGGEAVSYCRPADIPHWLETVGGLLRESEHDDQWARRRRLCLEHAQRFTWQKYTATMTQIYQHALQS